MNNLTLADVVRRHAAERASQPYLHYNDEWTTFGELDERTNRLAQALIRAGVGKGCRVALLAKTRPERCEEIGRATCRERVCKYVVVLVVRVIYKKKKKQK